VNKLKTTVIKSFVILNQVDIPVNLLIMAIKWTGFHF